MHSLFLVLLVGLLHYILHQSTYVLDKSVLATGMKWNTDTLAPMEIVHLKFPIVRFCEPDHCDEPSHLLSVCIFLSLPASILNDTYVKKFELTPATIFHYNRKYKPED